MSPTHQDLDQLTRALFDLGKAKSEVLEAMISLRADMVRPSGDRPRYKRGLANAVEALDRAMDAATVASSWAAGLPDPEPSSPWRERPSRAKRRAQAAAERWQKSKDRKAQWQREDRGRKTVSQVLSQRLNRP